MGYQVVKMFRKVLTENHTKKATTICRNQFL